MKTTSNGRQLQNIKSGIFQQPLIESSSNCKRKMKGPNQNWILLEMKMEGGNRSKNCLYLTQILDVSLSEHTKVKIFREEYLSNLLSDLTQFLTKSFRHSL